MLNKHIYILKFEFPNIYYPTYNKSATDGCENIKEKLCKVSINEIISLEKVENIVANRNIACFLLLLLSLCFQQWSVVDGSESVFM